MARRVYWATGIGMGVAAALGVAGLIYHQHQVTKASIQHKQREYAADMSAAQQAVQHQHWAAALAALKRAEHVHPTAQARTLVARIDAVDGPYLGVLMKSTTQAAAQVVSVAPGSPAAKAGIRPGDRLLGGAPQRHAVTAITSGFYSVWDVEALVDKTKVGQTLYVQVDTPQQTKTTLLVRVGRRPSGIGWTTGYYQNARFGVSINLPVLHDQGLPFGWAPLSTAGSDGSGRTFFDPHDPVVSISVYGMNNALGEALSFNVPPSATILNATANVLGNPGIVFKDTTQQNGVAVINEGMIVGSAADASLNGVQITVPKAQWTQWQPVINAVLNSFTPGDLSQAH
ncbi:PDZ domain-containing protein [Sulfobacillus harzensis]|uniref:PDZ domain-containing protein n=1 Tax=Sulfobacillus harzensis TaxID=2729629 RepID=A0A7Y0LAT1_9FIRM|nr:PDZ domain-containing protein [Sulfobacillus harzensis]NMP25014.1 PDZ domain-containing protein [Sulfobacillus harzensis]